MSQEDIPGICAPDNTALISTLRRRKELINDTIEPGSLNVLSAKYEVPVKLFYFN